MSGQFQMATDCGREEAGRGVPVGLAEGCDGEPFELARVAVRVDGRLLAGRAARRHTLA